MKTTDFALYLNKYFTVYLPNESGCTPITIDSYRYAFILYLTYMQEELHISADRIQISDLTHKNVLVPKMASGPAAEQYSDKKPTAGRHQQFCKISNLRIPRASGRIPAHPRDSNKKSTAERNILYENGRCKIAHGSGRC